MGVDRFVGERAGDTGRGIFDGERVLDGARAREAGGGIPLMAPMLFRRDNAECRDETGEAAGSCSMNWNGTGPTGDCTSCVMRDDGRERDCERERPPTGTGIELDCMDRRSSPGVSGLSCQDGVGARHAAGEAGWPPPPAPLALADILDRGRGIELRCQ